MTNIQPLPEDRPLDRDDEATEGHVLRQNPVQATTDDGASVYKDTEDATGHLFRAGGRAPGAADDDTDTTGHLFRAGGRAPGAADDDTDTTGHLFRAGGRAPGAADDDTDTTGHLFRAGGRAAVPPDHDEDATEGHVLRQSPMQATEDGPSVYKDTESTTGQ